MLGSLLFLFLQLYLSYASLFLEMAYNFHSPRQTLIYLQYQIDPVRNQWQIFKCPS